MISNSITILISHERVLLLMDLFILRHGKAAESSGGTDDAARALTGDGKDEIKKVARWMKSKKFRFDVIATSPLKRAFETAEIIARSLGQEDRLTTWDELAPGGDPGTVCYHASQYGKEATVLIIGHEPSLSMLVSRIISGNDNASIVLTKGGLAKIRNYSFKDRPSGDLQWLLGQKQIPDMQ
jgi:phosphohistidine phosphatase